MPNNKDLPPAGRIVPVPLAASVAVTGGQMAMIDSAGYGRNAGQSPTARRVVGLWLQNYVNSTGAAGDVTGYAQEGNFRMDGVGFAQSNVGQRCFAGNGTTVNTSAGNDQSPQLQRPFAGRVTRFVSATSVYVEMGWGVDGTTTG